MLQQQRKDATKRNSKETSTFDVVGLKEEDLMLTRSRYEVLKLNIMTRGTSD